MTGLQVFYTQAQVFVVYFFGVFYGWFIKCHIAFYKKLVLDCNHKSKLLYERKSSKLQKLFHVLFLKKLPVKKFFCINKSFLNILSCFCFKNFLNWASVPCYGTQILLFLIRALQRTVSSVVIHTSGWCDLHWKFTRFQE